MPTFRPSEDDILDRRGIADTRFADHSGDIQQGYELGSLTKNLLVYHPMDEGQGQVLHDGALNHVSQLSGPTWVGSGQIGENALSFDGTDDQVSTDITTDFSGKDFTISVWVNVGAYDGGHIVSGRWGSQVTSQFNVTASSTNGLQAQFYDGGTVYSASSGLTPSGWTHVGVKWDADTTTGRIYINGNEEGSVSAATLQASNENLVFGSANDDGGGGFYTGDMDDFRLYTRSLSTLEIEALSNMTATSGSLITEQDLVTSPDPEALARYEFENDVTDSWGIFDGTDNTSAGYIDGVYGQAKDFDGTDDLVEVSNADQLDIVRGFTASVWINHDTIGTNARHYVDSWGNYASKSFLLRTEATNSSAQFWLRFTDDTESNISGGSISTGQWTHVTGTWDGSTRRLYVNGNLVAIDTPNKTIKRPVGLRLGDNSMDGAVDDVRLYSRALSPAEVDELFSKGVYRINGRDIV